MVGITAEQPETQSPWAHEWEDLLQGVAGAFLFGVPLLYTMEVWLQGEVALAPHMLLGLGLTYAALVVLERTIGFRSKQARSWSRALGDSAEALVIGLLCATLSLLLLQRITGATPLSSMLGQIMFEGVPFGLGVGIANGLLRHEGGDEQEAGGDEPQSHWQQTLADGAATLLGATVISLSIAPTDEVSVLAAAMSPLWLLALVGTSLLLSYVIVFEANLVAQEARSRHQGLLQQPLGETVFSYLLSLLLAAALLAFFGKLSVGDPWSQWLTYTIVLGLPATLGGAAGRLAL